jgi:hypothetical protein
LTLPNFIIAGTARSATTSLYYYLKQHPQISFPAIKEPKYFSSLGQTYPHRGPGDDTVDALVVRDFASYERLFDGLEKYPRIGEASSDYLYFHAHTAEAIMRTLGDIPIILCLRNPTERAYSAYTNMLRDGRETLSFPEALRDEPRRLTDNWDWMWAYRRGSLYADHVRMFKDRFSRVKVVLFEDLESDPQLVLQDLYGFLEVDQDFVADVQTRYSHSGQARNPLVAFLARRDNPVVYSLRRVVFHIVPRSILEHAAGRFFRKDGMGENERRSLVEYFINDVEQLERILDRDLSSWK